MLKRISLLWDHIQWADRRILDAIESGPGNASAGGMAPGDAEERVGLPGLAVESDYTDVHREFAHIIGSEETWLARLEQRTPRAPVWPDASLSELTDLIDAVHGGYRTFLSGLTEADLGRAVKYKNSAGDEYMNEVGDILLHVALHGQYHRGKINLLLRLSGRTPAPTDYIAFVRGAAAATSG